MNYPMKFIKNNNNNKIEFKMSKEEQKMETTTAVANMSTLAQRGQDGIPDMLKMVKSKIAEITKNNGEKPSTEGKSLPGFGQLKDIKKVGDLIKAHSMVVNKARVYAESAKSLDISLKQYPFKLDGCSAKQWEDDIKSQVSILANKAQLDKLRKTQKLLEENLSQEAKLKNDLAKVADMFSDDAELE